MKLSRRGLMAGGLAGLGGALASPAMATPTLSGLAGWRWQHGEAGVLLYDPALAAGQRFAAAGRMATGAASGAAGKTVQAITGDTIRVAQAVLANRPAIIAGVSRHADGLLLADAAREAGYDLVAEMSVRAGHCRSHRCLAGWAALGDLVQSAGAGWVEALAGWAARPAAAEPLTALAQAAEHGQADIGLVTGFVLAPRG